MARNLGLEDLLNQWVVMGNQWPLVQEQIDNLISNARDQLSDEQRTHDIEDVRKLQGEIEAYKRLRAIPSTCIRDIEHKLGKKVKHA